MWPLCDGCASAPLRPLWARPVSQFGFCETAAFPHASLLFLVVLRVRFCDGFRSPARMARVERIHEEEQEQDSKVVEPFHNRPRVVPEEGGNVTQQEATVDRPGHSSLCTSCVAPSSAASGTASRSRAASAVSALEEHCQRERRSQGGESWSQRRRRSQRRGARAPASPSSSSKVEGG